MLLLEIENKVGKLEVGRSRENEFCLKEAMKYVLTNCMLGGAVEVLYGSLNPIICLKYLLCNRCHSVLVLLIFICVHYSTTIKTRISIELDNK